MINTKNRNHSINYVKNLGYDRWSIYKQPRRDLDLSYFSLARIIRRSVSPRFIELCMERPCCCLSQGHKWRPYNNRNICHWVSLLKQSIITLELWHVEINSHSSARTVQLAKTKAKAHLLTCVTAFSDRHCNVTQRKRQEIQTTVTKWRTLWAETF